MAITKKQVKPHIGKHVYVMTRNGQILDGVLHKVNGDKLYLQQNKKSVKTSAFTPFFNPFTPLVLFDLLAIEESPFFFRRSPFFF